MWEYRSALDSLPLTTSMGQSSLITTPRQSAESEGLSSGNMGPSNRGIAGFAGSQDAMATTNGNGHHTAIMTWQES